MIYRTLVLLALCASLAGCAAIEIDSHPGMPQLRRKAEAEQAATALTSRTEVLSLPGGVPASAIHPPTSGTLNLSIGGALVMALERNRSLQVDKINPMIQETFIAQQRAAFDPVLSMTLGGGRNRSDNPAVGPEVTRNMGSVSTSHNTQASLGLSEYLPTGTTIDLTYSTERATTNGVHDNFPVQASAGLSITQKLLQGSGLAVNLVSLRQARLSALSSEYELRGFTQSLLAEVEQAYWDCLYAQRQMKIYVDALQVAEKQLAETMAYIRVGKLAQTERYSAQSEVALRREDLINAHSTLDKAKLALLRLVSPPGESLKPRPIRLMNEPILPDRPADAPEQHIALALRMRPDLNQARLTAKSDNLEIVKTKNGLLPELDLFVNLGKTGYADSFAGAGADLHDSDTNNVSAQLDLTYALGNRAARATHRRAILGRSQQMESIANLRELVEQDVRGALIEIGRLREQIDATAATRKLQEETLRTEQAKLRVGKSTLLLVAQAERDLLKAQLTEALAATGYLKAIVDLYRLDGSLLDRRGIICPGGQPVTLLDEAPLP